MEMDLKKHTTIFYADDDVDDLEFFTQATEDFNEYISLFELGDDMLNVLKNKPPAPSLIFLDLNMPLKSGFDILKEIKASPKFGKIPVLILTTSTNTNDIAKCRDLGASLYIHKPTSVTGLRTMINFVLNIDWANFNPSDKEFLYNI